MQIVQAADSMDKCLCRVSAYFSIAISYSLSMAFNRNVPLILPFDFKMEVIEIPPAPTPSFTKPFAKARKPDLLDSFICRSTAKIGTFFDIDFTRSTRSDD